MLSLLASIAYDTFTFGPYTLVDAFEVGSTTIGPIEIHSFGLFVAIGLLTTFTLASRRGEQKMGVDGEEVQNFGIYLVVIGWIGAHVFNVLFYEPEKVMEDPLILLKVWGSISSYGGLFGGIIAAWIWRSRNKDKDFLAWCDLAAWSLTYSWFFGRVGCASVHDHPGSPTDFFLGIEWPDGIVRHDLGFYEAIWWFFICAAVLWLDRKPRPTGFYLAVVPMMYAPIRFTLDFLRLGPDGGGDIRYFGLTPAQYFSVIIFFVGVYFLTRVLKKEPMEWKQYDPSKDKKKSPKKSKK